MNAPCSYFDVCVNQLNSLSLKAYIMVIGAKYSKLHIANLSFISLYIFCTINIRQVDPNQNFTQINMNL